ncbi:MAG: UDP-3-O-(3-hydroxymyristoyl)glucosamine N-acyltransferase [Psittacicella sp.]
MQKFTLKYLADYVGSSFVGDPLYEVESVAALDKSSSKDISFMMDKKHESSLKESLAGIVILKEEFINLSKTPNLIVSKNPYVDYAKISKLLNFKIRVFSSINDLSKVDSTAKIGKNIVIGPFSYIGKNVSIGDNVYISSNVFIADNVTIGNNSFICDGVSIQSDTVLGKSCIIKSNAVIGGDGFGHANDKGVWIAIPQIGKVILGDNVEVGSSTCIDRGSLSDTVIESNVVIDNLCQIAHNVQIGYGSALAGAVTVAGGAKIGKYCLIGGASVLNGYITIADGTTITGMSMVMRSTEAKEVYSSGIPAQKNKDWRKTAALVLQINKLNERIKKLEKKDKEVVSGGK